MTWPSLQELFLYFFAYAFLGHIIETIFIAVCNLIEKKHPAADHHSFLHLPITPIYGFGAIIALVIFYQLPPNTNLGLTFIILALSSGLFEFLTGELLKRVFGKNIWWDYSHKHLQIDGQVCLENIIFFGIAGLLVAYAIQPFFVKIMNELSPDVINAAFWFFLILVFIDSVYSTIEYWQSSRGKKALQRLGFKGFDFKL